MKSKHVLYSFVFVFIAQLVQAQQTMEPSPELRAKLQHYVTTNHLYTGGAYMYFDTSTHKPIMFNATSLMIMDYKATAVTHKTIAVNASSIGTGGAFHLVEDVNTLTDADISDGNNIGASQTFAVLNSVIYFSADDGIHGKELWRSDGTAAGTYMVKDIITGEFSSAPRNITVSGSTIFFVAENSVPNSYSLWKTDGTAAGTVQVKDFTGLANSPDYIAMPYFLCDVNGSLYFVSSSNQLWDQLWKTDGTTPGTVLVKDFNLIGGSYVRSLVALNGILCFIGSDATYGGEIWRSDGTAAGTYMLKDNDPYTNYFNGPAQLTVYNGKLYFAEQDKGYWRRLWVTDGTAAGTIPVNNFNGVSIDYSAFDFNNIYVNTPFTISNGNLYFLGNAFYTGTELYKYDINNNAASIVKDIKPGMDSIQIDPGEITDVNGTVYFAFEDTAGAHLYKTKGDYSSTVELKTFSYTYIFSHLANGNGKLYFTAADSSINYEPWISDGTITGTKKLKEIYPGLSGSAGYYYTACSNKVLFSATDKQHGNELWTSNGSNALLVKEINKTATASSGYSNLNINSFKNGVLNVAFTQDKGYELYKANANNQTIVKDVFSGPISSSPRYTIVKNNIAYFRANTQAVDTTYPYDSISTTVNNTVYEAIFKTDGTAVGTVQITPATDGRIQDITVTDNGSVFYVLNKIGNDELWKTDGIASNIKLHGGFFINNYYDSPGGSHIFQVIGNTVYFGAVDYNNSKGNELWKSDGTVNGTVVVKDINPGSGNSNPAQLSVFNNQLYFSAFDGIDTALWKTDGTTLGTVKIKSVQPSSLAASNNTLFFNGYTNTTGAELWKTDGTSAGTVLVRDINIGVNSSKPAHLASVNDTLFFSASDSTNKTQLWKSDGTRQGTRLVKDIAPAGNIVSLAYFTSAASKLFFTVNNKLWVSDGTSKGTGILSDNVLDNLLAYNLTANSNQLFFEGYNYKYGYELYSGDVSGRTPIVNTTSFQKIESQITSADLNKEEKAVLLYPNPAKNYVRIRVNNFGGNAVFDVYDVSGKKVKTIQQNVQNDNDIILNVAALKAGVYMIKAKLNNKTLQQKFIKE